MDAAAAAAAEDELEFGEKVFRSSNSSFEFELPSKEEPRAESLLSQSLSSNNKSIALGLLLSNDDWRIC